MDNSNGSNNIIGEGTSLKGNLKTSGNVRLEGDIIIPVFSYLGAKRLLTFLDKQQFDKEKICFVAISVKIADLLKQYYKNIKICAKPTIEEMIKCIKS